MCERKTVTRKTGALSTLSNQIPHPADNPGKGLGTSVLLSAQPPLFGRACGVAAKGKTFRREPVTLEELLVQHSAPTLAGIKSSSLICLSLLEGDGNADLKPLCDKGLSFFPLKNRKGCALLLVYRESQLERCLHEEEAEELLLSKGYDLSSALSALSCLRERFLSEDFPHEVGIFLDYPVKDVKGFIENKGENYIISGLWKVYSDAEGARRTFSRYQCCSRTYKACYAKGTCLERLCVSA